MISGYRPWDSRIDSFIIGNENQSHIQIDFLINHNQYKLSLKAF